jgi:hypothetical protein
MKSYSLFAMSKNLIIKNKSLSNIKNRFIKGNPKFSFSTVTPAGGNIQPTSSPKKIHGGLSDADRIFTNVYRDGDPFIDGAIKRVNNYIKSLLG